MLPIGADAEAFEFFSLNIDKLKGEFLAFVAEGQHIFLLAVETQSFDGALFNGETVGVPAGDVGALIPGHGAVFEDDVFQDFIQSVTQMDIAVGVGRAVVENKGFFAFSVFQRFVVDVFFFPLFDDARFLFGEVAAHGKLGFR